MVTKTETARQRLFREVAERGDIPIDALAHLLGVKRSSLVRNLRVLVKKSCLVFGEGRRKVGVNPGLGYVIGIDLGASHLHFALADFEGEILQDSGVRIRPEDGPRKLIAQVKQGARDLARKSGHRRLRAVGIGVPSAVDTERGIVAWANNLPGWKGVHLGRELRKEFRVPIFMENDVNLAAVGEHWRGVARGVDDFVLIALGTGIGSGVFVDGKLYRGRSGWAGEVFRMNIEWQRWQEDFGDSGHLESCVAGLAIATEGRKLLSAAEHGSASVPSTSLREAEQRRSLAVPDPADEGKREGWPSGLAEERDAYFVFRSFHQGSLEARRMLEKIFTKLGVGVANVVAVLDPELIVLGGGIAMGAPEFMLATVEKVVRTIHGETSPPIKLSGLEDKAQTYGAIYSALSVAREAIAGRL